MLLSASHWFFINLCLFPSLPPLPGGTVSSAEKSPPAITSTHHCHLALCSSASTSTISAASSMLQPQRCPDVPMRKRLLLPITPITLSVFAITRYITSLIAPAGALGLSLRLQSCSATWQGHQQPWPSSPSLPYPPASSGSSASPFLVQVAALLSPFTCHPQGVPALLTPGGSPEQKKNSTTCYGRRNMDFGIRPRLGKVPDLWAMMVGPQLWWGWWTWWMWLCLAFWGCLVKRPFLLSLYPGGCWGLTNKKWTNILWPAPTHSWRQLEDFPNAIPKFLVNDA